MKKWFLLSILIALSAPCGAAEKKVKSLYKAVVIPTEVEAPKMTMEDAQKIIPIDFQPGVGSNEVVSRIADKGLQYWYDRSALKSSALGAAVESAQESLATNIEVPAEGDGDIAHRFSIRFEAFQGMAKLEYHGWLNAFINYDAFRAQSEILFNETVFNNKNLFVNHKITSFESLSSVGLSWNW